MGAQVFTSFFSLKREKGEGKEERGETYFLDFTFTFHNLEEKHFMQKLNSETIEFINLLCCVCILQSTIFSWLIYTT